MVKFEQRISCKYEFILIDFEWTLIQITLEKHIFRNMDYNSKILTLCKFDPTLQLNVETETFFRQVKLTHDRPPSVQFYLWAKNQVGQIV